MILSLAITALILSTISIAAAFYATTQVESFKKSTHKVMFYDTANQQFQALTDQEKEKLTKQPFDNIN